MLRKRQPQPILRGNQYSTASDFTTVFREDADHLYLLALLLTADEGKAEQSLVRGLEDCVEGNPVFRDWARAWSVRTVIKRAIGIVSPIAANGNPGAPIILPYEVDPRAEALIAAVTVLPTFDRFVFVMSVLEHYSDRDTSVLLNSPQSLVTAARVRALKNLRLPDNISTEWPVYAVPFPRSAKNAASAAFL